MSLTEVRRPDGNTAALKATVRTLLGKKRLQTPITALTAYDYPIAKPVDQAGIDMILVGDSVVMTVLGHEDTPRELAAEITRAAPIPTIGIGIGIGAIPECDGQILVFHDLFGLTHLPEASVVIKAAAVSDFRARTVAPHKLRREGPLTLELEPTRDIVAEVLAKRREGTLVVAFAAETEQLETNAHAKLLRKVSMRSWLMTFQSQVSVSIRTKTPVCSSR